MLSVALVLIGLVPLIVGVAVWHAVRRNDESGPDAPPPPPEPEHPLPIVPPSYRCRDRGPERPPRTMATWRARRTRVRM
jgi:hypothetical protein